MPIPTRTFKRVFAVILATGIIAVCGSILQSIHVRSEAEALLERSRHLDVGSSSYEQVVSTLRPFHRYQSSNESCSSGDCELEYRFDNTGMRTLRLVPPTSFYFSFGFHNGLLTSKKAILGQGICCVARVREVKFNPGEGDGNPGYNLIPNGAPYKVLINLDTRATEEEKRIAYQFNLDCLTAVGGCKDAHQLLPGVWR